MSTGKSPSDIEQRPQCHSTEFSDSETDARDHILRIRESKIADQSEVNTSDLEAALTLLAEQLYQKSTHFLLELIQNADDNSYNARGSSPILKVEYDARRLILWCNEQGFNRRNVEAICRVGRSTKSKGNSNENSVQYIGEKGVGFKSVFRVAAVVWILSGKYSFKFDKRQRLGMIVPLWAEFPLQAPDEGTSMLLDLSDDCDVHELLAEIRGFDPRCLIFLRKLKQLVFSIREVSGDRWESTITREPEFDPETKLERVELTHNNSRERYLVTRHRVIGLPIEPKRGGLTATEVRLAFPVTADNAAKIGCSQQVYAFLPIRDYGFRFILHADFLLVANREDIDRSSAWNQALLPSIAEAFLAAVHLLNSQHLHHTWPKFLHPRSLMSDFFSDLDLNIIEGLSGHRVLQSAAGRLEFPAKLVYVPGRFRGANEAPFTLCASTEARYLASPYDQEDYDIILQRLGVSLMRAEDFVYDLGVFVRKHRIDFRKKPCKWHSDLGAVLSRLAKETNNAIAVLIAKLEIVPLKDGEWVSANSGHLLFPTKTGQLSIPQGLNISEIHPDIDDDTQRKEFLEIMGAKPFTVDQICERIADLHSTGFPPSASLATNAICHVLFVFDARWADRLGRKLLFVAEDGTLAHGEDIYIRWANELNLRDMPPEFDNTVKYLHQDYFASLTPERYPDFAKWAAVTQSVNRIPRLVAPTTTSPFSISSEFQVLLKKWPGLQVLELIKSHWGYYGTWIGSGDSGKGPVQSWDESKKELVCILKDLPVECLDGTKRALRETTIPFRDSSQNLGELPTGLSFIKISDPDDTGWAFLSSLGVAGKPNIGALLGRLTYLSSGTPSLEEVSNIYSQLHHSSRYGLNDTGLIRSKFDESLLIHVPKTSWLPSSEWYSPSQCIWDGGGYLRRFPTLKGYYPGLRDFLCTVLHIENESLATVLAELRQITPLDDLAYMSQLFKAVSEHLQRGHGNDYSVDLDGLTKSLVFPVTTAGAESSGPFDKLLSAEQSDVWFIADRHHLRRSFEGIIPLLAFSVEDVERMGPALNLLGVSNRLISRQAMEKTSTSGSRRTDISYTKNLRRKLRFLPSLLPRTASEAEKQAIIKRLKTLEVCETDAVVVEWTIKAEKNSVLIKGKRAAGRVKLASQSDPLVMYLTRRDIDAASPPYDLCEELRVFCGIQDATAARLLQYILLSLDESSIRQVLEQNGIAIEDGEDDWNDAAAFGRTITGSAIAGAADASDRDFDRFRDLVRGIEGAASMFRSQHWRDYESGELDPLLAGVCELDNQSTILLPGKGIPDLNKGRGLDMDGARVLQLRGGEDGGSLLEAMHSGAVIWPALFIPSEKGSKVVILGDEDQASKIDSELSFLGEFMVSRMLEKHLPQTYQPKRHWTSTLRSRAGLEPHEHLELGESTFTILDTFGELLHFMTRSGYRKSVGILSRCTTTTTFHIHVVTTTSGALGADFLLGSTPMRKAEALWLESRSGNPITDVFILAVVSNVKVKWRIDLFVDPWDLHTKGMLRLGNVAHYIAQFQHDAPHVSLGELHRSPMTASAEDSTTASTARFKRFLQLSKKVARNLRFTKRKTTPCLIDSGTGSGKDTGNDYQYEPLDALNHFRLLELKPGKGSEPLEGVLRHLSLDDVSSPSNIAVRYAALSYEWGCSLLPFQVKTPQGTIWITQSLHNALRLIRGSTETVAIWVDALCIDQQNLQEKGIQIRLMRKIFQSAKEVYAYLGEADEHSDRAMEALVNICAASRSGDGRWTLEEGQSVPPGGDTLWGQIRQVLGRGWFRRIWVIQEAVLAKKLTLYCGTFSMGWDTFWKAIQVCMASSSAFCHDERGLQGAVFPAYILGRVREFYNSSGGIASSHNLLTLLHLFSYTEASKPVDKLFGLLGLADDADDSSFDPDYDSPPEKVALRYATTFVKRREVTKLLCRAGGSRSFPFPSWIPNWTRTTHSGTISTWYGHRGLFAASRQTRPEHHHASVVESAGKLRVQASRLAKVGTVGTETLETSDLIKFLASIVSDVEALPFPATWAYPPTGESRQKLGLALAVGGTSRPHFDHVHHRYHGPESETKNVGNSTKSASPTLETLGETSPAPHLMDTSTIPTLMSIDDFLDKFLKQPSAHRQVIWDYWHTVTSFSHRFGNARFFFTGTTAPDLDSDLGSTSYYAGMGPGETEVGDEVWIVHGMGTPVMLRPKRLREEGCSSASEYELVGEAYVHDLAVMYGDWLGPGRAGNGEVVCIV